jgi:hypothetical protein
MIEYIGMREMLGVRKDTVFYRFIVVYGPFLLIWVLPRSIKTVSFSNRKRTVKVVKTGSLRQYTW